SVSVVLGMECGIDGGIGLRVLLEGNVPLDTPSLDPALTGFQRALEPGVVISIRGPDVDIVNRADDPDGDEGSQAAIWPSRGQLKLVSVADLLELVCGPAHKTWASTAAGAPSAA